MIDFPLFGDNDKANSPFKKIINGALGKVIILDGAATTANGKVPPGEVGFYGTTLYFNIGGTTYSVALVAV